MTPDPPRASRASSDAILYQFTAELLPPGVDPSEGKRVGRPDRSSSLPPTGDETPHHLENPVLYQFTAELLPPGVDPYEGKRIGRPDRSPSLPPADDADGSDAGPEAKS